MRKLIFIALAVLASAAALLGPPPVECSSIDGPDCYDLNESDDNWDGHQW